MTEVQQHTKLDDKLVSALVYGDIVNPQGHHVMQTDVFYTPGRLSTVYLSNGDTMLLGHADKLPFYGNIMRRHTAN
ncbi:MAG: hypothetical protein U0526_01790 [Candidatus Saccharibacteria bacterium]|jgi:hypothetical protein